ncbi:hypothetical protein [Nostoc mirabile]|uniref:hypothetical protein n=1 Tax=Nostoc mirabile TaxID=2907820 RepID=UPI001E36625E|nr:hypothetical protein [Nostoc mirabile]
MPLEFHRRQLHRLQHSVGHIRSRYGGTISAGFKRGSVIKYPKFGFCYVGGFKESPTKKDPGRKTISLHCLNTGKRLTQNALPTECKFKGYSSWRATAVKTAVRLSSTHLLSSGFQPFRGFPYEIDFRSTDSCKNSKDEGTGAVDASKFCATGN